MPDTIATSQLSFWSQTGLSPEKNYIIDNISVYLSTPKYRIWDFQFLELKPKMSIKLNREQNELMFDSFYDVDYCHIFRMGGGFGTDNDAGAYYFVVNKRWKAINCIEFDLEMDVINTFRFNGDYFPTARTLVLREHKDRWTSLNFKKGYTINVTTNWGTNASQYFDITENKLKIPYTYYTVDSVTVRSTGYDISYLSTTYDRNAGECTIRLRNNGATITSPQTLSIEIKFVTDAGIANVDLQSEGINAPLFKQKEQNILDKNGDVTWILHYYNKDDIDPDAYNQVNPVRCELLSKDQATFAVPTASGEITTSTISNGEYFYYFYTVMGPLQFAVNNDNYYTLKQQNFGTTYSKYFVEISNNSGSLTFRYALLLTDRGNNYLYWTGGQTAEFVGASDITVQQPPSTVNVYKTTSRVTDADTMAALIDNAVTNYTYTDGSSTSTTIVGTAEIDRTDSKNIKIIEIPYCPSPIQWSNDGIILTGPWSYISAAQCFRLQDNNEKFYNSFVSTADNPINNLFVDDLLRDLAIDNQRFTENETKLYHSDYYRPKFVYDSFWLDMNLENLDMMRYMQEQYNNNFKVDFVMSTNIVSKFCFLLPQYLLKYSIQDYDNVINVARNNEQVLYTSQYINYLRNGYNYDLKNKQRQEVAGALGMGLSVAGLIGSIALTATGAGAGIGVAGIAGSLAGLAGSAVNYAKTVAQNEQNISQKLQESQNQAVSVLNADDVDLLNAYSGNRAKLCIYSVSERMKKALYDMFWYSGYATYEYKIPDTNTRCWFNFLQCELDTVHNENVPQEILELIKQKFKEGVTFFHSNAINGSFVWDLYGQYENWENTLLAEVA